jgi:hypothetical protein
MLRFFVEARIAGTGKDWRWNDPQPGQVGFLRRGELRVGLIS